MYMRNRIGLSSYRALRYTRAEDDLEFSKTHPLGAIGQKGLDPMRSIAPDAIPIQLLKKSAMHVVLCQRPSNSKILLGEYTSKKAIK